MSEPTMPGVHRCGPTPEQVTDGALRGEVLGTWPRCDACAAKEADLLRHVIPRVEPMPPLTFEPLHFDDRSTDA
jgi:hypothetical protein